MGANGAPSNKEDHVQGTLCLARSCCAIDHAAVAAPTWPTANVTYMQDAGQQAAKMNSAITDGLAGLGKTGSMTETIEIMNDAVLFFSRSKPPATLAPVGIAGSYAAGTCQRTFSYLGTLTPENANSPFAMPMITTMVYNCMESVQAVDMELARAIAVVGSYPPTK